jgi:hypothetical protein
MSHCLIKLKADPEAWDIFHPRHIESTDRLKNGYESYKRLLSTQSKPSDNLGI